MMHRGQHLLDNFETLCSIHALTVKRYRMVMTKELIALSTEQNEILVVAMAGRVKVDAKSLNDPVTLGEKDILYLPPGDKFNLRSVSSPNDVILAYAPASHSYRPYYKRFSETKVVNAGSDACRRRVYRMIVEKDPAERFLSGFTEG